MSSTATVAPGFTALTLSSIAFFSASVNFSGFAATVLSAGLTMSFPAFGLAASSGVLTRSVSGITAVFPSGVVTVVFPLSSTTTVAPGFTSFTFAAIAAFSSSVNALGSFTNVLSAGLTTSFPAFGFATSASVLTKSFPGITAVFPSGVVTVAFPLSSTTTVAPGFTALTLSLIAFFSASVNFSGFATTVLSAGLTMSFPAFGLATSSCDLTRSFPGITAVFPSGVVTNVFPLLSTTTVAPGFTSFTFAAITAFSSSVNLAGSFTNVLSAGFTMSFPAFGLVSSVSDLNKSSDGIVAVVPSFRVTVASPFSSNLTDLVSGFSSLNFSSSLA